jgi:uncharacterized Zn finger protein
MFKVIDFTCASCSSIQRRKVEISEKEVQVIVIECEMCGTKKTMKLTPVPAEQEDEKPLIAKKDKMVRGFGKEGWKNE